MAAKLVYLKLMVGLYAVMLLAPAFAQPGKAISTLDTGTIRIGEQTNIRLSLTVSVSDKVSWPLIGDTLNGKIDVVAKGKIDTVFSSDKKSFKISQNLTITSFDSGYWAIPPFIFLLNNDSNNLVQTEALLLKVNTLEIDTAQASIKDVKAPLDAPLTFKELLPWLASGLGLAALIVAAIWLYRKYRKKPVAAIVASEPEIPAHIVALQELDKLKSEKLWQEGRLKLYHIRLADILRLYLEKRFHVYAMEQTTDETMQNIRSIDILPEVKAKLKQVLVLSDMVKFAKANPIAHENEMSLDNAYAFVKETIPAETPETKEVQA